MRWEYKTLFLISDAEMEQDYLRQISDWKEGIPRHTPEALEPRLNALGEDGWELMHIQPVIVGKKRDVLAHGDKNSNRWASQYFCVFKRQVQE